jgi:glycosyltransferase involved in cell wall biosynthesis
MRALFLPRYGAQGASSRLRLYQFLPEFRRVGIEVQTQPLIDDAALAAKYRSGGYTKRSVLAAYGRRVAKLALDRSHDLVWIEKEALPWLPFWMERLLLAGRRYVLDFDDAVFHNYDRHASPCVRRLMGRRIDKLMAGARLVVAGNYYLAQRARDAGAPWVEVAPTVVDVSRYSAHRHAALQPPRIVWIGSPSTAQYLAALARPLARLQAVQPFVFRIIGAQASALPELTGVEIEALPWSADTEAAAVSECDVGVMPLFDTPWERGKCAYKLIQYMACGLPTVASAVGANNDVTVEGDTGYLVKTEDEWVDRLQRLLQDAALRQRLGQAGRLRVEQQYSLHVMAPRMQAWFEQAAKEPACAV